AIQAEADLRSRSWSSAAIEMLEEATRSRRVPGVIFTDGATGRRAVLGGTGLDIWELIAGWQAVDCDESRFAASYDWLSPMQLRTALTYYKLYPEEIDRRLAVEAEWTEDRFRESFAYLVLDPSPNNANG